METDWVWAMETDWAWAMERDSVLVLVLALASGWAPAPELDQGREQDLDSAGGTLRKQ